MFPTARRPEDVDFLRAQGFEAHLLDYEDPSSIHEAVEAVMGATDSKLDAVFNNGAYAIPGALEDILLRACAPCSKQIFLDGTS